jgi:hypothetical protein
MLKQLTDLSYAANNLAAVYRIKENYENSKNKFI